MDVHGAQFAFTLNPLFVDHDQQQKTSYELVVPGRKSKGNRLPLKGNFHAKAKITTTLPHNANTMVQENILEFDIKPH